MSNPILVSVVVVSWNGRSLLERCLPPLVRSLEGIDAESEIIVVDNGSIDGTAEFLARRHPHIVVVRNSRNMGFAAANNQGFARARGRFVATLNNDTEVDERWLAELLAVLRGDAAIGSACAQIRYLDRPDVVNSAGITVDRAGVAHDRRDGEVVTAGEVEPTEVFGACAGAALYRAEMLESLGGFDEAFFAYFEDVDLAWRARRAGWRCVYVPTAVVLHAYSQTSDRIPDLKAYLVARNRLWVLAKNASARQLGLLLLPGVLLQEASAMAGPLLRERTTAGIRGRWAAARGLPRALRHRGSSPFLELGAFTKPQTLGGWVRGRLPRLRQLIRALRSMSGRWIWKRDRASRTHL